MNLDKFFTDNPEWRPFADLVAVPPTAEEIRQEFPDADRDVLERSQSGGKLAVGTLYVRMRREGQSDRWAAMCALQQAPRIMTDSVFFEGNRFIGDQFSDYELGKARKVHARHGRRLDPTSVYHSGLARFQYDPEAFVPATGGRAYVKQLMARRGWSCEGAVSAAGREPERDPMDTAVPLAEDLIRSNARQMVQDNPDLKRLSRRELRERVLEKHGPSKQ